MSLPHLRSSLATLVAALVLGSACSGGTDNTGSAGSSAGGSGGGVAGSNAAGSGGGGPAGASGAVGQAGGGGAGPAGASGTTGLAGSGGAGPAGGGGSSGSTGIAGSGAAGHGGAGGGTAGASPAGSGGRGGAAGATAGTSGGAGTGAASGFFSDGFESGTVGMQPPGWSNFIAYVANNSNPSGTTLALVDSTRAHTGTKSVHFHGGQSPTQLTRMLPTGTNKLYVRAWIYFTRQLGMNPGANHETLIGIRKLPGQANDEVRFGEIKGVIGTNEVPSDNIAPKMAQWGMGPVVAAGGWRCIEVAFLADQAQHTLYAWADGTMVHSVTAPDQWQNGNLPANWLNGKFVEVIMGWQSFSGIDTDLWIDDVVLSNSPIGCN
jgi:hypothetical protein